MKRDFIGSYFLPMLILAMLLAAGCSAVRFLKADPAPDYGFLPRAKWLTMMPEVRPFNASWITKRRKTYASLRMKNKNIYIAPIDISFVKANLEKEIKTESIRTDRIEEAEVAAGYFHEILNLAFSAGPLTVVDQPGPDTFELKLALVQIQPTNPAINALGTAAGFFVPGGGLIKSVAKGEVAMEGYIQDYESQDLLEQFKDREIDKAAPFSVKDFQQYGHVRASMGDWTEQLVEIMTKPVGAPVEDSLPFSINPF